MSIKQPFALLIVLGLRMVEFRSFTLAPGTWFWIVSSGYMPEWVELLQILESQNITLHALEAGLHCMTGHTAPLGEDNFRFYFPTQAVLGKVQVEVNKPSLLSFFHQLNPQPAKWTIVWELGSMHYIPAQWRASFKRATLRVFKLPRQLVDGLEGHLRIYCQDE